MAIYIVELLFILLASIILMNKRISSKAFLIFSFSMMALVLGLRGKHVGEDTLHYISVFESCNKISWGSLFTSRLDVVYDTINNIDRSMEVGYMALNKIIRLFTSNAQWLLLIVACATCFLMGKFIYSNCAKVFVPTYIFFCESLYMQSFNLARQMLAVAIGLQAYTILKRGKKYSNIRAAGTIFLAFLFHKSAVALLILIPLWMCKNNRRAMKYTLIGCALAPLGVSLLSKIIQIIIPRYSAYFVNNYWESNVGGTAVLWGIETIMVLFMYFHYKNKDGKEPFIATTCIALYIALEVIGLKMTIFTRITLYFRVFLVFLFPYFAKYIKPRYRLIYTAVLLMLLTALFLSYASSPTRLYEFFWM